MQEVIGSNPICSTSLFSHTPDGTDRQACFVLYSSLKKSSTDFQWLDHPVEEPYETILSRKITMSKGRESALRAIYSSSTFEAFEKADGVDGDTGIVLI